MRSLGPRGLGSQSTRVQGGGYVVASLARGALSQERAPMGQTCKNPARCFRIPSQSRPALQMTSLALSMQDWNNLALQVSFWPNTLNALNACCLLMSGIDMHAHARFLSHKAGSEY